MPDTTTETDNITREVTIDAPVEDVWEAVSTDEGRERWLEPDDDRTTRGRGDRAPEPHQLVVVARERHRTRTPRGREHRRGARWRHARDVTETQPAMLPIAQLLAIFEPVCV